METTYKGDSPGKKTTRARLWQHGSLWMSSLGIPYKGVLVLAGHGGDLSTLQGLGIDITKATGVDVAQDAVEYCQDLYPETDIVHGDVAEACKDATYNAAHLDFCNSLNVANLHAIRQVMLNAEKPAYIAVTMLKGRESGSESKDILMPDVPGRVLRELRSVQLSKKNMVAAHFYDPKKSFDPKRMIKSGEELVRQHFPEDPGAGTPAIQLYTPRSNKLTGLGLALSRASVIMEVLRASLIAQGIFLRPVIVNTYQSRTKAGSGTPFFTVGFIVTDNEPDFQKTENLFKRDGLTLWHVLSLLGGLEKDCLRLMAIELAKWYNAKDVAQILDISSGKVAAWKAHETMGSYGGDSIEEQEERQDVAAFHIGVFDYADIVPNQEGLIVLPIPRGADITIERRCEMLGFPPDAEIELVMDPSSREESLGWSPAGQEHVSGQLRLKEGNND